MLGSDAELRATGARIAEIKDHEFRSGKIEVFGDLNPGDEVIRNATDAVRRGSRVSARVTSPESKDSQ